MPLQIPHPNTPLHLYRHLLRESTYLPALCRPWIASRIQQRFRDCYQKDPPAPYIKQAHASLRYLRSANTGHVKRLERLCFQATGRVGKRSRSLATAQLYSRPATDTAELEQRRVTNTAELSTLMSTPTAAARKPDWLDNWSIDMISTLAHSQVRQQNSDWPHTMRRGLDPKQVIERGNCFGRPFPPKVARNKLKKHWAAVLHQLLPPLPRGEWDHLASLVEGDVNAEELKVPTRRPVARCVQDNASPANEQWDWSQHVLRPARAIERGSSRRRKSLTGEEDHDPRGHGRPIGIGVVGPRRLQRIYRRVWQMSPIIEKSNKQNKQSWSVTWGGDQHKISAPSSRDLLFFQGVGKDGLLPKRHL
ncbi:hypothetical protein F5Y19DRAFT_219298 [Xylariaceae sp. FL1651]|nr:hypothetical protein F5Y19DRAFT_219298 [Xylariaceae sp. FL1651]